MKKTLQTFDPKFIGIAPDVIFCGKGGRREEWNTTMLEAPHRKRNKRWCHAIHAERLAPSPLSFPIINIALPRQRIPNLGKS
jgi:hypothetical protein